MRNENVDNLKNKNKKWRDRGGYEHISKKSNRILT